MRFTFTPKPNGCTQRGSANPTANYKAKGSVLSTLLLGEWQLYTMPLTRLQASSVMVLAPRTLAGLPSPIKLVGLHGGA